MVINGSPLLKASPIADMQGSKAREHGVSYGLGEAGYDIRLAQEIRFFPGKSEHMLDGIRGAGMFTLASAMEEFQMPTNLVGIVHDKSTWARRGVSVQNTVIEPGWHGHLTLEIVYYGGDTLIIPKGAGIAQVIFHQLAEDAAYTGKYQNQKSEPTQARFE